MLAKTITDIPHLSCWKIEGRKKGPHYVYHVVTAYKMLRDNPDDPQARKDAEKILEMALGRPSTRARFLPQRTSEPTSPDSQTSSGRLVGKIQTDAEGRPFFKPGPLRCASPAIRRRRPGRRCSSSTAASPNSCSSSRSGSGSWIGARGASPPLWSSRPKCPSPRIPAAVRI